MENENILRIRVSGKGNEMFGTSFNPNEITKGKFLSKFTTRDYIDFFDLAMDLQSENEQSENKQSENEQSEDEQSENEQSENEQSENKQSENEQSENEQSEDEESEDEESEDEQSENEESEDEQSENEEFENEEFENEDFEYEEIEDDEFEDDEFEDDEFDVSDYSIDTETFFEDMYVEIDLNGKTIFEYGSLPSDVKVVQHDTKESYKDVINPPENEVCVLWLYYQNDTSTFYWNDIVDFDIKKLKFYCSTRFNEIESKEYKLFSGLTYDEKDYDDEEFESQPGPGLDGPYTF